MNFAIPFVAVALIRSRWWSVRIILVIVLALLLFSEFLSQGRGPWVGLTVAMAILIFGLAGAHARRPVVLGLSAGVIGLAGLSALLSPQVAQRLATFGHLMTDVAVSQRFIYYRAALRAIVDHPLVGIGFENFRNSYPLYRGPDDIFFFRNIIPTMVHDGYLEVALNSGLPALLLYLALIAVVLLKAGKEMVNTADRERRDLLLCLLAASAAYLVQDLSGWLEMALAAVFWVILGLAANLAAQGTPRVGSAVARPLLAAYAGIMLLLSIYLLGDGYARIVADARLFAAQALDVKAQWPQVEMRVNQGLEALPADSRSEMIAARRYADRFVATQDLKAYARARELFEAASGRNPFDRMRLINIVALETAALESGRIASASDFARNAVSKLAQTDRDNPPFHEFAASFFAAQGQFDAALDAIHAAQRLAPDNDRLRLVAAGYLEKQAARGVNAK